MSLFIYYTRSPGLYYVFDIKRKKKKKERESLSSRPTGILHPKPGLLFLLDKKQNLPTPTKVLRFEDVPSCFIYSFIFLRSGLGIIYYIILQTLTFFPPATYII